MNPPIGVGDLALGDRGLGDSHPKLCLYTPHRPPLHEYEQLDHYRPAHAGECQRIITETGNHWRKIFSIFAKINSALYFPDQRWQELRDQQLFCEGSHSALVFQNTPLSLAAPEAIHIIGGKDFASSFAFPDSKESEGEHEVQVLTPCGRLQRRGRYYITPYLDYRQFTNEFIELLLADIRQYHGASLTD